MPAVVTERWSERTLAVGKNAMRVFDVTGVDDETAARVALIEAFSVLRNALHPQDDSLICDEPEVGKTGPVSFVVRAPYQFQAGGTTPDPDPLRRPARFSLRKGKVEEVFDVDANGAVVTNSAGFPFANKLSRPVPLLYLSVKVYRSTLDIAQAMALAEHTNSQRIMIPRVGIVEPGQMYCDSIMPTHDWDETTARFEMDHQFILRRGNVQDAGSSKTWDAFKARVRDEGFMGWYDDSGLKPGEIVNSNGASLLEPALLDGTGKPINANFKIKKDTAGNLATPAAYQTLATGLVESAGGAKFLKYWKVTPVSFASLGFFTVAPALP